MKIRRLILAVSVALATAASTLGSSPATAAAGEVTHEYLSQITGTTSGSFKSLWGVAIDQGTGDLWITQPTQGLVDEFDASDDYVYQQEGGTEYLRSVAVDDTTHVRYLADSGPDALFVWNGNNEFVSKWGGGGYGTEFGSTYVSAAVDNSSLPSAGDVYVTVDGNPEIDVVRVNANNEPAAFTASASYIDANKLTGTPDGPFDHPEGIATDSAGDIYVADEGARVVDEFESSGTFVRQLTGTPSGAFGKPINVGVDSANGHVYVVDEGRNAVDEFDSAGQYLGALTGAGSPVGSFEKPKGVAVDSAGDVYVSDVGHHVVDKFGPDIVPAEPEAPVVDGESVTGVTSSGATVHALVDPKNAETTVHFEYVTEAQFQSDGYAGAQSTPESVSIGFDHSDHPVSAALTGLSPNTTYHFRVVAHNSVQASEGADQTFTTYPPAGSFELPDERAYEMVSPVDKNGGSAGDATTPAWESSPEGNKLAYEAPDAYGDAQTSSALNLYYLATRGSGGWSSHSLLPPQAPGLFSPTPQIEAFSTDLSKAILADGGGEEHQGQDSPPLVSSEPPHNQNLFLRDNLNDTYSLVDVTPEGVSPTPASFEGASADMSHIVFDEKAQLVPDISQGVENLYEWTEGAVSLVSLLPDNTTPLLRAKADAVSADGSHVYFDGESVNNNLTNIYLRIDGARTVQVDAAVGGNGSFQAASADGAEAFFTHEGDLYRYEAESGTTTDLAPAGEVQGLLGISEDGSYVYFVADAVLTGVEENGYGAKAEPGKPNLYVSHEGTTSFIATLAPGEQGDRWDWGEGVGGLEVKAERVTPDGTHLAFDSIRRLTGYDNTDAVSGAADREVFLYDATSGRLVCASCNPSGARPVGSSFIGSFIGSNGDPHAVDLLHGLSQGLYEPRYLSGNGGRLFFDSLDSLVPGDTNGREDVYEWEVDGEGSCRRAAGCVYLISTGVSGSPSTFQDASADGSNVFFTTVQPLVPQDGDENEDVYDARVGGGFSVTQSAQCSGEACQAPSPGSLEEQPPATLSLSGAGNVAPPPATAHTTPRSLMRSQLLTKALKACRRKPRRRRAGCEATARKRYGAQAKKARAKRRAQTKLSTGRGR